MNFFTSVNAQNGISFFFNPFSSFSLVYLDCFLRLCNLVNKTVVWKTTILKLLEDKKVKQIGNDMFPDDRADLVRIKFLLYSCKRLKYFFNSGGDIVSVCITQ